jgi:hypothetical protein
MKMEASMTTLSENGIRDAATAVKMAAKYHPPKEALEAAARRVSQDATDLFMAASTPAEIEAATLWIIGASSKLTFLAGIPEERLQEEIAHA